MEEHLRYRSGYRNTEDTLLAANKFPWKLWKIVNGCHSGAIHWSNDGRNVVMNRRKFQREYLDPQRKTFKTNNIGSFVRQLNLYGFKKVQPACKQFQFDGGNDQEIQEFHNEYFRQGRPDLVHELKRHVGVRRAREQATRGHATLLGTHLYPEGRFKRDRPCFIKTSSRAITANSALHSHGSMIAFKDRPPSMVAVPIYSDGIPYIHPSLPPVLVEWERSQRKWIAKGPVSGINVVTNANQYPEGARLTVDTDLNSQTLYNGDFCHLVNAVSDAIRDIPECVLDHSTAILSSTRAEHSDPCTPISFTDNSCDDTFPISFSSKTHKVRPGDSLLRVTSSPNSPIAAEMAPELFDGLDLSPIIVPCEQALVQAALGTTLNPYDDMLF